MPSNNDSSNLWSFGAGYLAGSLFSGKRKKQVEAEVQFHEPESSQIMRRSVAVEVLEIMEEISEIDIKLGGEGKIRFDVTDIDTGQLVEFFPDESYIYSLDLETVCEVRSHLRNLLSEYKDKLKKHKKS